MDYAFASLQAHFWLPVRVKPSKNRNYGASSAAKLSFRGISLQSYCLKSKLLLRSQRFSFARFAGETTTMPKDCSSEQKSSFESVSSRTQPIMNDEEEDENEGLDDHEMIRVCDKLIGVFLVDKPTPSDWRKLLAYSKEWNNLRHPFFRRCQERADTEDDPEMRVKLLRLERKLKEIDKDVQRHNELLEVIKAAPSEINEIVSRRRKDFTEEFFMHFHAVAQSYNDNATEQNALFELGNTCLAAVQAYDTACGDEERLNAAKLKFDDIINSPSLDVACRKIDSLAEKNQLDSSLVMMITKAWSAAKETDMVKEEVKDTLYYLYLKARENLQKSVPPETRILKYILRIEDPEERLCALNDAFAPPENLENEDEDILYTTPEELHLHMSNVVNAYLFSQDGTLLGEARNMLNPEIIEKIKSLIKIVEKYFM